MKTIWIKSLAAGLAAAVMLSFGHFEAVCGEIRGEVVRLHVLANSDSEEDQALKLQVRDAVLAEADGLLDGIEDTDAALAAVSQALPRLQSAAQRCLLANSSTQTVQVELCEMYFTTRTYDAGTLPAGWYNALRVTVGEGAGQNWWCVVYPPLCLSAASAPASLSDVLDAEACDVVEQAPRYEIRFKLVEWLGGLFGR